MNTQSTVLWRERMLIHTIELLGSGRSPSELLAVRNKVLEDIDKGEAGVEGRRNTLKLEKSIARKLYLDLFTPLADGITFNKYYPFDGLPVIALPIKPLVATHPTSDLEVDEGSVKFLTTTWDPEGARYVWRKDGSEIGQSDTDFENIDTPMLKVVSMSAADEGKYACRAYSADGTQITTSNEAELKMTVVEPAE